MKYFPWTCETLVYQVTDSGSDVVLIDTKADLGLMSCCKNILKRVLLDLCVCRLTQNFPTVAMPTW